MKTSIATVSISGSLVEKLHACAAAGFDGVEIFEPDLIASDHSPEEIRGLADAPRAVAGPLPAAARHRRGRRGHVRREPAARRGDVRDRQRLGIDTVLVCSNVATATVDSDEHSADQLRRLGDVAHGLRRPGRLRSPGVGTLRRRLPACLAHRRVGRSPRRRRVPRQLPRAVPRARPVGHRGHPGREDLLPAARRRARADHGRAVVEPPPPAVSRRGRLRPGDLRRPRAEDGLRRAAVARGLQRHLPPDRPRPHGGARAAVAASGCRTRWLRFPPSAVRQRSHRSPTPSRPWDSTSSS